MLFALTLLTASAYPVIAAKVAISVGSLAFTHNSVTAVVGDIVELSFFPVNNSVTVSDFDNHCIPPKVGGFNSGFYATDSGQNEHVFQVAVNTTEPISFYCGFPSHCQNGMAGIINPGNGQTLEAYQRAAQKVKDTIMPDGVFGGQVCCCEPGFSDAATGQ